MNWLSRFGLWFFDNFSWMYGPEGRDHNKSRGKHLPPKRRLKQPRNGLLSRHSALIAKADLVCILLGATDARQGVSTKTLLYQRYDPMRIPCLIYIELQNREKGMKGILVFVCCACVFDFYPHKSSFFISVYSLSFSLSINLSGYASIHPSIYPSIHLSIPPSIHPSIHPSTTLSICKYKHMFVCLFVCLFVCYNLRFAI